MRTSGIAQLLDREFRIQETADPNMTKHALTEHGRAHVLPAFHERKTGLMFDFADAVGAVYCATFMTAETIAAVLDKATGPSLLFTHHPFDYHEDSRGLGAVPDDAVEQLRKEGIAVYAIHAPLDVGKTISVSQSLAGRLPLSEPKPFYAALGGHLGVYGRMELGTPADIAQAVGASLGLETVDLFDNGGRIGHTAVVAGGGDQIDIVKEAEQLGCTTYITGTAVHRWERMTKANRDFQEYVRGAKINLIGGTHYNTEKCAVQDVAAFLNQRGFAAEFIEDPVLSKYTQGNFRLVSS